ncbi:MAG: hypothetical protein BJ554DRAFT_7489 [Olpidium bornovanus]|uniref:Uncharacterized protein n=1 Tax=Olpidium bornovanus TaxID=278681 RepID=A0A8H7ZWD2_9FUNG|nr:MAG: hypothetical protein BJ554DRAFT_7489 [Olpidium bornovanus]
MSVQTPCSFPESSCREYGVGAAAKRARRIKRTARIVLAARIRQGAAKPGTRQHPGGSISSISDVDYVLGEIFFALEKGSRERELRPDCQVIAKALQNPRSPDRRQLYAGLIWRKKDAVPAVPAKPKKAEAAGTGNGEQDAPAEASVLILECTHREDLENLAKQWDAALATSDHVSDDAGLFREKSLIHSSGSEALTCLHVPQQPRNSSSESSLKSLITCDPL